MRVHVIINTILNGKSYRKSFKIILLDYVKGTLIVKTILYMLLPLIYSTLVHNVYTYTGRSVANPGGVGGGGGCICPWVSNNVMVLININNESNIYIDR